MEDPVDEEEAVKPYEPSKECQMMQYVESRLGWPEKVNNGIPAEDSIDFFA